MKRILFSMFGLILAFMTVLAGNDKAIPEYELEGQGTGAQGTYLVKVTVITKDKKISNAQIGRAAVHGVLFRGFSSKEHRQHQRPLAGSASAESQHPDFFQEFFDLDGGAYKNYVEHVDGSRQVMKSGKQYRVSANVVVRKDDLRRELETAGVIRGLNSGF